MGAAIPNGLGTPQVEHLTSYLHRLARLHQLRLSVLAAIAYAHRAAGLTTPTLHQAVREVRTGVRRTHGAPVRGKAALMTEDLRRLLELLDRTPLGLRDRALLLLGFAGAFRRSELVSLDVEDLEFTPRGVRVQLRRSKTDQEAQGRPVGVPYGTSPEPRRARCRPSSAGSRTSAP